MGKVKVKNKTRLTVMIQEGNAGEFATRRVLKSQQEYTLKLDGNATYREYVLITLPDNTKIEQMFSSDDVADYREILIKERETTKKDASGKELSGKEYYWVGILRGERSEDANSLEQDPIPVVPTSPAADPAVVAAASPAADPAVVAAASPAADPGVVAAASPAADRVVVCSKSMSFFQKLKKKFS